MGQMDNHLIFSTSFLDCLNSTIKKYKADAPLIITEALDAMMKLAPEQFRKLISPIQSN